MVDVCFLADSVGVSRPQADVVSNVSFCCCRRNSCGIYVNMLTATLHSTIIFIMPPECSVMVSFIYFQSTVHI